MSNPDETTFGLEMPFIICASQQGPYADEPFAAGWTCGELYTELAACRQLGARPHGRYVPPEILPQVDLIAMKHGFTVHRDAERNTPAWAYIEFQEPPCACGPGTDMTAGD